MTNITAGLLETATFCKPQRYRSLTIVPLVTSGPCATEYYTLGESLVTGLVSIMEVHEGGSVPELKVTNKADRPVLLLDGEELAGAKQNRVLNTTVLLAARSDTLIPVSCTEQGRWAYTSHAFSESGNVMASSIRASKTRSVSDSLEHGQNFQSNQGAVWSGIARLQSAARIQSPTSAMSDVYHHNAGSLHDALQAFPAIHAQTGILAIRGRHVMGFDLISQPSAYGRLHGKLVKSYLMDELVSGAEAPQPDDSEAEKTARQFLQQAQACSQRRFKSVGSGDDYRFCGEQLVGSALLLDGVVVHTAFFRTATADAGGHMSGFNRRRSYRGP